MREGYTVLEACALVGISNRTAYNHRAADGVFARDWDLARRATTLPLELVAFQRAVDGVEEPVYAYGRFSHMRVPYSDALLARLLVAEQPGKYGAGGGARRLGKRLKRLAARVEALEQRLGAVQVRGVCSAGGVKVVKPRASGRNGRNAGNWRLAAAWRRAKIGSTGGAP
ncbi:MAG: hypothetical protein JO013_00195 [Alphaproteobacteria bacterium]|nr:hypothetical protein [Alphaproteobacteria bacterium]